MIKVYLQMSLLFFISCGITQEEIVDFEGGDEISGISFYTEGELDSGRVWHDPSKPLELELKNLKTLSTCNLLDPILDTLQGEGENSLFIQWNYSGYPSVNCPIGSTNLDTLLEFDISANYLDKDSLILYGYEVLPSDTLSTDSLEKYLLYVSTDSLYNELTPELQIYYDAALDSTRNLTAIDTILLSQGEYRLDSFRIETDSFRTFVKKIGDFDFGVIKALYKETEETYTYTNRLFTCPESSYDNCAVNGFEWDTIDAYKSLDTTNNNTGYDTLVRTVSQFCTNGISLCDNGFRIDSILVQNKDTLLNRLEWHSYFYEKTTECNEWNLWKLNERSWVPSVSGQKFHRNAEFTLFRERFDRIEGSGGCSNSVEKNLWMSLDSLRPVFNADTIRILDSLLGQ